MVEKKSQAPKPRKEATAKPTPKKNADAAKPKPRATPPQKPKPASKPVMRAAIVSPEERYRLIEKEAYYRAEQRGFLGGNPAQDWLDAEAYIDAILNKPIE